MRRKPWSATSCLTRSMRCAIHAETLLVVGAVSNFGADDDRPRLRSHRAEFRGVNGKRRRDQQPHRDQTGRDGARHVQPLLRGIAAKHRDTTHTRAARRHRSRGAPTTCAYGSCIRRRVKLENAMPTLASPRRARGTSRRTSIRWSDPVSLSERVASRHDRSNGAHRR